MVSRAILEFDALNIKDAAPEILMPCTSDYFLDAKHLSSLPTNFWNHLSDFFGMFSKACFHGKWKQIHKLRFLNEFLNVSERFHRMIQI
jgi:hypothetical protein